MRGSPIFRTLTVLLMLALTGFGLAKLTHHGEPGPITMGPKDSPAGATPDHPAAHYHLILSAEASKIEVESAGAIHSEREGSLQVDPANPVVMLRINWSTTAPGHRFAKLVIDQPGKDSMSHVFDASGDLDDIWEITP